MQSIVITGASSGIGEALALHYAASGRTIAITGRNEERLAQVARQCEARGAKAITAVVDVRDRGAMSAFMQRVDGEAPVDLVIANAGVIAGATERDPVENADAAHALLETNILGAVNTIQPVLPAMMARKRGQIALVSSIAAFVPLDHAPSYGASKAALLSYGRSLRGALIPYGVGVSVICPGYVDTRMSQAESGAKPFIMRAEKAAAHIAKALARNRETIVFPFFFGNLTRLSGLLPSFIHRLVSKPFAFVVKDKGTAE